MAGKRCVIGGFGGPLFPKEQLAVSFDFAGEKMRVYAVKTPLFDVVAGSSLRPLRADVFRVAGSLFAASALALLASTVLAWWYSGRAFRSGKHPTCKAG